MKGNGKARTGVLDEINARLAAITPEQYSAPETKREHDATFVLTAPDHIKALHTLRMQLRKEMDALRENNVSVVFSTIGNIIAQGPRAIAEEMKAAKGSKTLDEMQRTTAELGDKIRLIQIVDDIFWEEVTRLDDVFVGKRLCIYADWSLCWQEREAEAMVHLIEIAGSGMEQVLRSMRSRSRDD